MQQSDTLVSRAALRDAIRDDLSVALKDAEVIADASFDGAPVLTIPDLTRALDLVFTAPLAPPTERHAEVSTPATIITSAICPRCALPATVLVELSATLVVDSPFHAEIKVAAKSKSKTHVCGQAELPVGDGDEVEGQTTIAELLEGQSDDDAPAEPGASPDEKLDRHLRAVDDLPDDDPGTCPYPGCARAVNHRGLHRDADGKKLSAIEPELDQEGTES